MVNEHPTPRAGGETGNEPSGFPRRLLRLVGDSSIRGFARKAGVSDTFLRQCLAGRTEPTRTKLILLADAGGCSVEWLATGNGSAPAAEGIHEPEPGAARVDAALLRTIIETVEEVLAEHRHILAPGRKALVVAALYDRELGKPRPALAREDILALMSHVD
jgi:transcriptional regulator with XRE-family HTH domain